MEPTSEMLRFYVLTEQRNGLKAGEIHQKLVTAWDHHAPGLSTIHRWLSDFSSGSRSSFSDAVRAGRPLTTVTAANIALVREIIHEEPRLSTRDVECLTGIPRSAVHEIFTSHLNLRNVCSVWIPHLLSAENKSLRVGAAKGIRSRLQQLGDSRYDLYAVEDETWVFFDPSSHKQANRVWIGPGDDRPQVVRQQGMTTRKTLLLLAFTPNKRFSVKAMPHGETVTADVYTEFLRNTGDKWRRLHRNPVHLSDLLWQHDNARPHTAVTTKDFCQRRGLDLLWQAPYSPDLNLCDRFLFHLLKTELYARRQTFNSHLEIEEAALSVLRDIDESLFQNEVDALLDHCEAIIHCGGDYVTF